MITTGSPSCASTGSAIMAPQQDSEKTLITGSMFTCRRLPADITPSNSSSTSSPSSGEKSFLSKLLTSGTLTSHCRSSCARPVTISDSFFSSWAWRGLLESTRHNLIEDASDLFPSSFASKCRNSLCTSILRFKRVRTSSTTSSQET